MNSTQAQPPLNQTAQKLAVTPKSQQPQQQCPIAHPSYYEPPRQVAPRDYLEVLPPVNCSENPSEDDSSNAAALRNAAKKFVQMQQQRLRSPIMAPRFVQPPPPYDCSPQGAARFPATTTIAACANANGSPARLHRTVMHHSNGCVQNNNSAAFPHQPQYAELLPNGSMHNHS